VPGHLARLPADRLRRHFPAGLRFSGPTASTIARLTGRAQRLAQLAAPLAQVPTPLLGLARPAAKFLRRFHGRPDLRPECRGRKVDCMLHGICVCSPAAVETLEREFAASPVFARMDPRVSESRCARPPGFLCAPGGTREGGGNFVRVLSDPP